MKAIYLLTSNAHHLALALTLALSIPVSTHTLTERYSKSLAQYESTALETGVLETGWGDEDVYLVEQNTLHQPYPIRHEVYEKEWLRLGGILPSSLLGVWFPEGLQVLVGGLQDAPGSPSIEHVDKVEGQEER